MAASRRPGGGLAATRRALVAVLVLCCCALAAAQTRPLVANFTVTLNLAANPESATTPRTIGTNLGAPRVGVAPASPLRCAPRCAWPRFRDRAVSTAASR
jgi:hypothetical protein